MHIVKVLRKIWKPLSVVVILYVVCVSGFIYYSGVSLFNGIYWGVITMSTVGYGDIVPTNPPAKVFAMVLAGSTIGVIGYVVSTISTLAIEAREEELLGLDGTKISGHVVVLGWNPVARSALEELILTGKNVAVMTRQQDKLTEIRTFVAQLIRSASTNPDLKGRVTTEKGIYLGLGDYSQRRSLELLNLPKAIEAIVASDDDARNLMTALLLKNLAPHLRVVVSAAHEELRETLHAAGVTYVVSPMDLGGRMVSAAAAQPEVAEAINDLTSAGFGSDLNEYPLGNGNPLTGLMFEEAHTRLRQATGALLVGVARPRKGDRDGRPFEVILDPPTDTRLDEGCYALILVSMHVEDRLHSWIKVPPGRPPKGPE
ncbi:MAG: potassium channel family protein [Candidatus Thermoplasmatota archaeon]|nr:potassium channel family protein [Candidatus Thermoplasmatota archaeon]